MSLISADTALSSIYTVVVNRLTMKLIYLLLILTDLSVSRKSKAELDHIKKVDFPVIDWNAISFNNLNDTSGNVDYVHTFFNYHDYDYLIDESFSKYCLKFVYLSNNSHLEYECSKTCTELTYKSFMKRNLEKKLNTFGPKTCPMGGSISSAFIKEGLNITIKLIHFFFL